MNYKLTKQLVDLHRDLHSNLEWVRTSLWDYDLSEEFIDKAFYLQQLLDNVVTETNNLKKLAYKEGY